MSNFIKVDHGDSYINLNFVESVTALGGDNYKIYNPDGSSFTVKITPEEFKKIHNNEQ